MEIVKSLLISVVIPVAYLALASCGGGGGRGSRSSDPDPPPVENDSPGGIWKGTTSDGAAIVGLVTETGEFTFLQANGVQYFCNMSVSGSAVSSGFTFVTPVGATFPDGATFGSGSLTATIAERSTLNGSINFDAVAGTPASPQKVVALEPQAPSSSGCGSLAVSATAFKSAAGQSASSEKLFAQLAAASGEVPGPVSGTFSLAYDSLYDRDSSLATIAGTFSGPSGTVVNVNADGSIFSQDATTGCVVNGKASIINARYNVYRVQYTYGNCAGDLAAINGTTFAGLATLDNSVAPEQAIVAVTYQSETTILGVVEVLDRI